MPPANSPSDTRPSTPPHNPYLLQIEEAIATPVPDLASTLNLNSPDPGSQNERWANRPRTEASEAEGFNLQRAGTSMAELTEEEFQEWAAESQGRRTATQARRDEVRGLREERDPPVRVSIADTAESLMFSRQRPPDFGTTPTIAHYSDDSDADMEPLRFAASHSSTASSRSQFLRLEGVLQRFRSIRGNLRYPRNSDMGAVPTASALRAFWNEEADDDLTVTIPGVPGYSSAQRREPVPRVRHSQIGREPAESGSAAPSSPRRYDAFRRVRKLIRYLSQLRHTGIEGGLEAARELGLDSLYASDDSYAPSDLPMHINSLPVPQYSSWLQAGMVWHGLQSTEREPIRASSVSAANFRRERQRELIRRTIARRRERSRGTGGNDEAAEFDTQTLVVAENYLSDLILQDTSGRWGSFQRSTPSLSSHPTRTASQPAEPDHWPVKVAIHSVDWEAMTVTGIMSASQMPEKLPSLYQPDALHQGATTGATTCMSSFFVGEIIDFRRQPLETEKEGRDYEVGGLGVDARYWERLGPFRKEIERIRHLRGKKRSEYQQHSALWDAFRKAAGGEGENKDSQSPSDAPSPSTEDTTVDDSPMKVFETPEDKEAEGDEIMARSLGSAKWIEEKLGKEWILMRWKERCFVTPPGTSTNARPTNGSSTRTIFTTAPSGAGRSTGRGPGGNSNGSTSWGLTIAGFYYIALNRLTGEIDGLYYDPGSQPYQTIKMLPEGTTVAQAQPCGCGEQDCREPVGVKKWFPAVEFR
ncbi:uncharacterized protein Z520_03898 [Fonsecaea multimorphosa CBS 102226]|uniref:Post-SET domain-containing protein n=1 Tax=Fonsecaea multimorphosa CBS 102226 TaxID=1442371 RepID=A0A0D2K2Z9_9EURO|nr:uncharacterized protein Z520_03898 [Fonsecaea multimorphosa CBS 102226]KIY00213.1 hypothetical protein Z520_03898 [Fonsecaea multimorphosa CBS 102226]OAL27406.1 hypothetical protein AYO22_03681 [Fonsecaea multimorphosa]